VSTTAIASASAPKTAASGPSAEGLGEPATTPTASEAPVLAPYGQLGNETEPYVRVQKVRGDVFFARLLGREGGQLSFRRINGDEFKIPEKSVANVNGIEVAKLPSFGR
jgi:hypothetical protein